MTRRTFVSLLLCLLPVTSRAGDSPRLRVFYTGHSFHMFVPARVASAAKAAKLDGYQFAGQQGIGGSRVIQHWDAPQTIVAKTPDPVTLPAEVIPAASTAPFPKSGKIIVETAEGEMEIAYSGKTASIFTGCSGGKGALRAGARIGARSNPVKDALKA